MPGPVRRAGGDVTLPWAATVATKTDAAAREVLIVRKKKKKIINE